MSFKNHLSGLISKLSNLIRPIYKNIISGTSEDFNYVKKKKIELIDYLLTYDKFISSFADLGGIWGVDGIYTFYILRTYNIKKAYLIDNYISNIAVDKASKYPQLKLYQRNFGSDEVVNIISKVDIILLFDIILHQVNPNWDEFITKYAPHTKYFIIMNPQFDVEKTVRLLDLGKEEYLKQIPKHNTYEYSLLFTDREEEVRDSPNIWQWGINDSDLRDLMKKLNFEEIYHSITYKWVNTKFTSKGFIFKKKE